MTNVAAMNAAAMKAAATNAATTNAAATNDVGTVNRIQGKSMLENKKLSDREIMYQFLRRISIQNCTIAYDIVNRDSNEKRVFKAGDNNVIDVTTPALITSQKGCQCWGSTVGPHVDTDRL